jgi:DNA-binding response OmpR family regulator
MKVLIVDDDASTLTMLKLHLSRAGFAVETALDAVAAERALRRERFDWLVADGQIEPVDGFELADRAKAIQPDLGIVMVSGLYERSDVAGHPIERLFPKPIDTDALAGYLRGGLARAGRSVA